MKAVNLGDVADTHRTAYGGSTRAFHGIDDVPELWFSGLHANLLWTGWLSGWCNWREAGIELLIDGLAVGKEHRISIPSVSRRMSGRPRGIKGNLSPRPFLRPRTELPSSHCTNLG